MNRLWIGFVPYAVVSVIHIVALAVGAEAIAGPTKLLLMPLLAVAVFWGGRGSRWGTTYTLLFIAIALSWLGDGAGTLFPTAPTVPMMLLFFGLAHLCYIWIFWRMHPRPARAEVGDRVRPVVGRPARCPARPDLGDLFIPGGAVRTRARPAPRSRHPAVIRSWPRAARSSSRRTRSWHSGCSGPTRCPTGPARSSCSRTASDRD